MSVSKDSAAVPVLPSSLCDSQRAHMSSVLSSAVVAATHSNDAPAPLPVLTPLASGKWEVQIFFAGKMFSLGVFDCQAEATAAYERAKGRNFFSAPCREEAKQNIPHDAALDDIKFGQQKKNGGGSGEKSSEMKPQSHEREAIVPAKKKIPSWHALQKGSHVGDKVPQRSSPSGREVWGAPAGLSEKKVSAKAAKGGAPVARGEPFPSKGTPVAKDDAESPTKRGATKRNITEDDDPGSAKRARGECRLAGCTNWPVQGGVCSRHGARRKYCGYEGCANLARIGGVCVRHKSYSGLPAKEPKRDHIANPPVPTAKADGEQESRVLALVRSANDSPQDLALYNSRDAKADGLDLLCSAMIFTSNGCKESLPNNSAKPVADKGVCISHVGMAKKGYVEGCNISDARGTNGLGRTNWAEKRGIVEETTKNEEGQKFTIRPLSDDDDEDIDWGALVYKSSFTAKARAEETKLNVAHEAPRRGSARSSDSLLLDSAAALRQDNDNDKWLKSFGTLEDFEKVNKKAAKDARALASAAEAKKAAKKVTVSASAAEAEEKSLERQTPSPKAKSKPKAGPKKKPGPRPFNRYNIYFIFEREKLIQSKGGPVPSTTDAGGSLPIEEDALNIPPRPRRFANVKVPRGWYIPRNQKRNRRPHRKTHGVATFQELAKSIAASWKVIDDETLKWTMEVEKILKENQPKLVKQAKILAVQAEHESDTKQAHVKSKKARANVKKAIKSPDTQIVTQDAQGQVAKMKDKILTEEAARSPDVQMAKQTANGANLVESTMGLKNFAGDGVSADRMPYAVGTAHNEGIPCTHLKSPSPVTSKYEPPFSVTSRNVNHSKGHATWNNGLQMPSASTTPSASKKDFQSKEELRAFMVNYSKNHMPISGVAAPLDHNANMLRQSLPNTGAAHEDTVGDLEKYMYMMKCAQILQNKAATALQRRIAPHLSYLSDSMRGAARPQEQQPCSLPGLPIHTGKGGGASNHPRYDAASATQRMTDYELERLERALKEEQARRKIERARSASGGEPLGMDGPDEGHELDKSSLQERENERRLW